MPADPSVLSRHGVGVVWQDLALCDNLDIAANLMLGRERRRQLRSEVRMHTDAMRLLEQLGVPLHDTTRSVRSLSGGQRQLVAVARAMAAAPRMLLLDEPTAALGVQMSAQVEGMISRLRESGTGILLACHDIDQMFRLADRIVVLRHGRVAAEVMPAEVHPDDVIALLSGQELDSSARRQLTRLHGLTDRLVSADPSSSLSLILSALGAALGSERLCIHLRAEDELVCSAALGLPPELLAAWARLPAGPAGGPVGVAAQTLAPIIADNARAGLSWMPFGDLARTAKVAASWSVPVFGPGGLLGVITVLRSIAGRPKRDDLDLVTLYAGYAAAAIERDRLLDEVTTRNRVLETIREMLETLAGPLPVADGLTMALQSLRLGLQAAEVALVTRAPGEEGLRCRAVATTASALPVTGASPGLLDTAAGVLGVARRDDVAVHRGGADGRRRLAVTFAAPGCGAAVVAEWPDDALPADAKALLEDAANSLRLALEREEAELAHQQAVTLRRSHQLQRDFFSRLSHELRTPLTAIRGYASSLLPSDVTWDDESKSRFLNRIATESARIGRLVGDLLDFSAIESGLLRLQPDWCDLPLVMEAAISCLPPEAAAAVPVDCDPGLPVSGPTMTGSSRCSSTCSERLPAQSSRHHRGDQRGRRRPGPPGVTVADDGAGLPGELAAHISSRAAAADGHLRGRARVVDRPRHRGRPRRRDRADPPARGACFRVRLPVEAVAEQVRETSRLAAALPEPQPGQLEIGVAPVPDEAVRTRALLVEDDPNIVDLVSQPGRAGF